MLAELAEVDIATASTTSSVLAASSSSSTANMAEKNVSEEAIVSACIAGNLFQLRRYSRLRVRLRMAAPLYHAVCTGAVFDVLFCLVKELGADVNERGENGLTVLTAAAGLGHHDTVRYLVEELGADVNIPDKMARRLCT